MKVFCIGFHKTGTTSLGRALELLGYRVVGATGVNDPDIGEHVHALADQMLERYDAFQDNPWPLIYRYLDERCPGSKFILTVRSPEAWIRSQVEHFGLTETPMRQWIYGAGCPQGHEELYLRRFRSHGEEVRRYFAERPRDLLVMDLARGDGWEQLCPFLGVAVPAVEFPFANKAGDRKRLLYRLKQQGKRIIGHFARDPRKLT
jgi:Sulfotransferase domain